MDKKTKKIIIITNIILIAILVLVYFIFIHNNKQITYTKDYDKYMCWKIKKEATLIGELHDTKIYIKELDDNYYQDFVIYYLYNDNEYSELYYTGKHDSVRNGDYLLAKLKKKSGWKKYNITEMYFAYDPWWGNEVELHIKNKDGEIYIVAPTYDDNCEEFCKKILDNSDLDTENLKDDMSYWD